MSNQIDDKLKPYLEKYDLVSEVAKSDISPRRKSLLFLGAFANPSLAYMASDLGPQFAVGTFLALNLILTWLINRPDPNG